jgi:hypothetical protein
MAYLLPKSSQARNVPEFKKNETRLILATRCTLRAHNGRKKIEQKSPQLMQMRRLMYAMRTLRAGITTVRDVGSSPQEMYAMRDVINN